MRASRHNTLFAEAREPLAECRKAGFVDNLGASNMFIRTCNCDKRSALRDV